MGHPARDLWSLWYVLAREGSLALRQQAPGGEQPSSAGTGVGGPCDGWAAGARTSPLGGRVPATLRVCPVRRALCGAGRCGAVCPACTPGRQRGRASPHPPGRAVPQPLCEWLWGRGQRCVRARTADGGAGIVCRRRTDASPIRGVGCRARAPQRRARRGIPRATMAAGRLPRVCERSPTAKGRSDGAAHRPAYANVRHACWGAGRAAFRAN